MLISKVALDTPNGYTRYQVRVGGFVGYTSAKLTFQSCGQVGTITVSSSGGASGYVGDSSGADVDIINSYLYNTMNVTDSNQNNSYFCNNSDCTYIKDTYRYVSGDNFIDYYGNFTVTVKQAENIWTVTPSIDSWIYGENADIPKAEAKFGDVKVTYTGEAYDRTGYNSTTAPTKAGNYFANFEVTATSDYTGLSQQVSFEIIKATYDMSQAEWNYTEAFQYDGKVHKVEVVGLPTGVEAESYENNTATVVGDYIAKVSLAYDANNYRTPSVAELNWKIENNWNPTEYTTNGEDWINNDFVIAANEGYELSLTNTADGPWSDSLTGDVEGKNSITFYVKNETTGAISLAKKVDYKLDKNTETSGTTGKVSFDERNEWENFLNTITFGLFYKDEVTVKVEADDRLSGVANIEYYEADKELTLEEVEAITDWTAYENGVAVTVEDAKQFVYYVRITDKAGNVSYFSTDGAEYDITAPVISGIENGNTYYTTQKLTITDKNMESITLNGEAAEESITLEGNKEAAYTIVATDKAGNVTTYTVAMKVIADVDTKIDGVTEENVTLDKKDEVQDIIDKIDEFLKDENLTDEEKAALEEVKDNAEKLMEKIKKLEEIANSPKTGNSNNLWMWFAVMFVSGISIFTTCIERKRRMTK